MHKTPVAAVTMLIVMALPLAGADLLAQNMPGHAARLAFPPGQDGVNDGSGGIGLVDSADPDNTCLALLSTTISSNQAELYYQDARTLLVGRGHLTPLNVQQDMAGTPVDDCFNSASGGLISDAHPGNDLVADEVRDDAGGGVRSSALLGASEVASLPSVDLQYRLCDPAGGTTNGAFPLTATHVNGPCGPWTGAPDDPMDGGWNTGLGSLHRNAFLFLNEFMNTLVDDHAAVEFCLGADLFDIGTGTFTSSSDRDHVLAITAVGFENPSNTLAAAQFLLDPANQSALVRNTC